MASFVTIVPNTGYGVLYTQVGPSAGYSAWDDRRKSHPFASEGLLAAGGYKVSQRAAGPNLSIDCAANVAATNGAAALVLGDSITNQGLYTIAAHTTVINVDISPAHATNPRNDLVILECKDDAHDVGGLNQARVRVVDGTATAGAAMTDALGVNGTPTLPVSSLPLAVVNVPALDTTIADAQINDRRTMAAPLLGPGAPIVPAGAGGKCIIATAQTRSNVAYGVLTTPDQVTGVFVPADGILKVRYRALWKLTGAGTTEAAIFIGSNQLKALAVNSAPVAIEQSMGTSGDNYSPLYTHKQFSLATDTSATSDSSLVTTGFIMGGQGDNDLSIEGLPAREYTVSVQFKTGAGTVSVKDRKLWCWTTAFG